MRQTLRRRRHRRRPQRAGRRRLSGEERALARSCSSAATGSAAPASRPSSSRASRCRWRRSCWACCASGSSRISSSSGTACASASAIPRSSCRSPTASMSSSTPTRRAPSKASRASRPSDADAYARFDDYTTGIARIVGDFMLQPQPSMSRVRRRLCRAGRQLQYASSSPASPTISGGSSHPTTSRGRWPTARCRAPTRAPMRRARPSRSSTTRQPISAALRQLGDRRRRDGLRHQGACERASLLWRRDPPRSTGRSYPLPWGSRRWRGARERRRDRGRRGALQSPIPKTTLLKLTPKEAVDAETAREGRAHQGEGLRREDQLRAVGVARLHRASGQDPRAAAFAAAS